MLQLTKILEDDRVVVIPIKDEPLYYDYSRLVFQFINGVRRNIGRYRTEEGLREFAQSYGFELVERISVGLDSFIYLSDRKRKYLNRLLGNSYEILTIEE